jgi:hypothetical protein
LVSRVGFNPHALMMNDIVDRQVSQPQQQTTFGWGGAPQRAEEHFGKYTLVYHANRPISHN